MAVNNFITPTASDDELWSWVGAVTYHRYGSMELLPDLAAFAGGKNLPTGMTEHSNLNVDRLYEDLTVGNVSYWEVYGIGSEVVLFENPANYNFLERQSNWWRFRQFMQYVRPGAVRVDVSSDDSQLRVLAWKHQGKTILNLLNNSDGTQRVVNIEGLSPGGYGFTGARSTAAPIERGLQTVGQDGTLTLTLPGSTIYTLYPHPGGNLPPYFTDFRPSVGYLVSPDSSFTLSAAAQDPEVDTLTFQWSLIEQPLGANALLATPSAATCVVSGLTVAGDYTFGVAVSDGSNTTTREVRMEVFAGNPAPKIHDMQNRQPVRVTLPDTETQLRSSVWNVDGDPLTYQWSVVSQPAGANAQFDAPTSDRTQLTDLTVAGEYVVRVSVSDGTSTVHNELTVPVYPLNTQPVVTAAATSTALTLPEAETTLNATCTDGDGDSLSHWWKLVSAPTGARPVFVFPTEEQTLVKGLVIPGTYSFQHVATDETKVGTSNTVTVTVAAGSSPELLFLAAPNGDEIYEPGQTIQIRWASAHFTDEVKLEFYDGSTWSEIVSATPNDVVEANTLPASTLSGCKIRISDAADGNPADESDAGFRIYLPGEFSSRLVEGDTGAGASLEWDTLPGGYEYQLYSTDMLDPVNWQPLGPREPVESLWFERVKTDADTGVPMRFYRVERSVME
ncbi:hypothetical protein P0Y35_10600 [Kiritimatiellaeota bacterium B1221]|nr:hypothetical protein [Kiritimatiellaeota bacterium B1221]